MIKKVRLDVSKKKPIVNESNLIKSYFWKKQEKYLMIHFWRRSCYRKTEIVAHENKSKYNTTLKKSKF